MNGGGMSMGGQVGGMSGGGMGNGGVPPGNFGGLHPSGGGYVKLSKYIGIDNQERCLLMRGCPWTVTEGEIVKFFEAHGKLTS